MKLIKVTLMELIYNARRATEEDTMKLVDAFLAKMKDCEDVDTLLTESQVAEQYPALKPGKLRTFRNQGGGPRYIKTGSAKTSRIYYRRSSIEAWINSFPERF